MIAALGSLAASSMLVSSPYAITPSPSAVSMASRAVVAMSEYDQAMRKYSFRLEYQVNDLSDRLGMVPPARREEYHDETVWISVLEECLPYLERQWSTAAKAKASAWESMPSDALDASDRGSLRERYVQRLERQLMMLGELDNVADAVSTVPVFSTRASDEAYVAELECVVATLERRVGMASGSAVW